MAEYCWAETEGHLSMATSRGGAAQQLATVQHLGAVVEIVEHDDARGQACLETSPFDLSLDRPQESSMSTLGLATMGLSPASPHLCGPRSRLTIALVLNCPLGARKMSMLGSLGRKSWGDCFVRYCRSSGTVMVVICSNRLT